MSFNISDYLNPESKKEMVNEFKTINIDIDLLDPSPDTKNFYSLDDERIVNLANTIELIDLQQNLVVRKKIMADMKSLPAIKDIML